MNILTGLHSNQSSSTVTIFYTYFSTTTDPNEIIKHPGKGAKKCEMFKRGYVVKLSLFENGITFKFREKCTVIHGLEQKGFRSFKIHLHPQRLKTQIYTLADLATDCGLSGLRVVQYFSKILADVKIEDYNKAS